MKLVRSLRSGLRPAIARGTVLLLLALGIQLASALPANAAALTNVSWSVSRPIPGDTPYDRMLYVLSRVTRTMQREPMLTEAMTRAFMFADPSAAAEVNAVARQMERMFTRAMHDGEPSADDAAIARVIGDVWLSALVAWVTRRASANDVSNQLELAARLLLR